MSSPQEARLSERVPRGDSRSQNFAFPTSTGTLTERVGYATRSRIARDSRRPASRRSSRDLRRIDDHRGKALDSVVEKRSPLLAGKVEIEVLQRTEPPDGQTKLRR